MDWPLRLDTLPPINIYASGTQRSGTSTALGRILELTGAWDDETDALLRQNVNEFREIVPFLHQNDVPTSFKSQTGRKLRLYTDDSKEMIQGPDKLDDCRIAIVVVIPDNAPDIEDLVSVLETVEVIVILVNQMDEEKWEQRTFVEVCEYCCIALRPHCDSFTRLKAIRFVPTAALSGENLAERTRCTNHWAAGFHTYLRLTNPHNPQIQVTMNPHESAQAVLERDAHALLLDDLLLQSAREQADGRRCRRMAEGGGSGREWM